MGRMQGKSGGKASVAAKGPAAKVVKDQAVTEAEASENKSDAAPSTDATPTQTSPIEGEGKGPDNNKRLAALESDVRLLIGWLAEAGFTLAEGENPIALAGAIIDGHAKYQRDGSALHDFLGARTDFSFREGETCLAAAARVIADLDAKAGEATPGELAAIKRAAEAEANYEAASNQLAAIQTFILSHDDFETVEGEELPETVIRFVGGQEIGPIADGDPGREQLGRLVAGQVKSFTALPEIASFSLMFADGDAVLDVAPRSVSREEISREGERAVYDRRLMFSPAEPPHNIISVWLVAFDPRDSEGVGDVAAVRCDIPGGLRVGGGAQAAIPAGHLIF